DASVVRVIEWLRHHPAVVKHRPERIAAASVVMSRAYGRFGRIAAHDHELHSFAEIVWERFHAGFCSLRLLLTSLLPFEIGGTLFDVSSKAFLGVFAGEEKLLEFALETQGFAKGNFHPGDHGALDAAHGARGFVGRAELAGVGKDVVPEGFLLVDVMNQVHL